MFKIQIESLSGHNFEEFVEELYMAKYGSDNVTPIRPTKDKGCDLLLEAERRVLACWGPTSTTKANSQRMKRAFKEKITSDHMKYENNWMPNYPNFSFVINHAPDPDYAIDKSELRGNIQLIGIKQILNSIKELPNSKQIALGESLRMSPEIFRVDLIENLFKTLLKTTGQPTNIRYQSESLIKLPDKIDLYYKDPNDQSAAKDEFFSFLESGIFGQIESLFLGYTDAIQTNIKMAMKTEYGRGSGSFKEKLAQMQDKLEGAKKDTARQNIIRATLLYLFEQCHLGDKERQQS